MEYEQKRRSGEYFQVFNCLGNHDNKDVEELVLNTEKMCHSRFSIENMVLRPNYTKNCGGNTGEKAERCHTLNNSLKLNIRFQSFVVEV